MRSSRATQHTMRQPGSSPTTSTHERSPLGSAPGHWPLESQPGRKPLRALDSPFEASTRRGGHAARQGPLMLLTPALLTWLISLPATADDPKPAPFPYVLAETTHILPETTSPPG